MQRLNEFDIVTINLPRSVRPLRLRDFECIVVGLTPSAATLRPVDDPGQSLPGGVEHVLVTFDHNGGLVGLKGALTPIVGADLLGFRVEDGVQVPRHRATRVAAELPVTLQRDGDPAAHRGVTVNVAADGLLAATHARVDAGDVVQLSLELPTPQSCVRARGRVVRHGDGLVALELLPHAGDACMQIGLFVATHIAAGLPPRVSALAPA